MPIGKWKETRLTLHRLFQTRDQILMCSLFDDTRIITSTSGIDRCDETNHLCWTVLTIAIGVNTRLTVYSRVTTSLVICFLLPSPFARWLGIAVDFESEINSTKRNEKIEIRNAQKWGRGRSFSIRSEAKRREKLMRSDFAVRLERSVGAARRRRIVHGNENVVARTERQWRRNEKRKDFPN